MEKQPYEQLEELFGEWVGSPYTVACNSGTSALHLALESFRFPKGSEVIVPEFTFVACARAVRMAGLVPVFVDCKDDLTINPELIRQAITDNTVAIMPAHIYGRLCDMATIWRMIDNCWMDTGKTLIVIEDRAEAHGAPSYLRAPHAACYSFYRNKIIAGEEGGMIVYRDDCQGQKHWQSLAPYDLAKRLRSMGMCEAHNFDHYPRGINARLANALAIPIIESLSKVSENLRDRRIVEEWYGREIPDKWRMPPRNVPWVYDLRIPLMNSTQQGRIVDQLNRHGVAARYAFLPMSDQREFRKYRHHWLPNERPDLAHRSKAFWASQEVIYLPITPEMSYGEVEYACGMLFDAAQDARIVT